MQFSAATFTWALHGMCQLQRIPFVSALVLRQVPPPYDQNTLQQTARTLGFRSAWAHTPAADLGALHFPCLALLASPSALEAKLALLLACEEGMLTYAVEGDTKPLTIPVSDFERLYAGQVLQYSAMAADSAAADPDAGAAAFGFSWFVPELLKHKDVWRDVLLASLAIQLMALAVPLFTQIVIDKVVVHHTLNTLAVIGVALGLILVFTAAMSWVRQYLVMHTGNRVDAVLGSNVLDHLLMLPPRYFDRRPTGTLVARIQGVESIREFLSGAAVTLLLDLPFLLIFLAIMVYYSGLLTLIALGLMGVIVVLSAATTPALRTRLNDQFLRGARMQAFLTEYISGMETVKSLQMEPQVRARYGEYLASYLHAGFNTRQLANTYNVIATALEQLLTVAVLCAGAWLVMQGDGFTIGMLVAFQMLSGRVSQPLLRLVGLWQEFQQAAIAVKRLGDIMNVPMEPYSISPSRELAGRGDLAVIDLGFRYDDGTPWLYRGLGMRIRAGSCVAIVGGSGSGKSTLARLLQGFYLPSEGQIRLDGRDIRHLAANELRQHFGVVPQETTLFSGTIYDNLVFSSPLASFQQVVQACKLAGIHETIEQLPLAYKSEIGEHGAGLSGGQKQRIAIARALLKQPRILIFDEATSNLDHDTAEQFAVTVNQLKGRATLIFITHQVPRRLAVDDIIELAGTHPASSGEEAQRRLELVHI
jgi:subfamily B ATP-binding cassette protein HlyB/CyaB